MQKLSSSNIVLITTISLLFLLVGHSFILQRTSFNATKYFSIGGDTYAYVSMIEGNWNNVPSPFKFRILVPFLASLLPLSPTESLRLISYLSLFFCYLFILLTSTKMGLNTIYSTIGLLAVWASTWHLYYYHNPFLTDAFGLLIVCIMIYALFTDSFFLFLATSLFGVLARETTIFLVPVWLVKKEWRRSILVIAISVLVLLIPRHLLATGTDPTMFSVFERIGILQRPLTFVKNIFLSWGFVWFLSIIGVWYLPNDKFVLTAVVYISLLCGAIFTSLIATDTGRMFSILAPILGITCAQLYAELIKRKHILALVFVGLTISQAFVSIPNTIFGVDSWVFGLPRIILLVIEIAYVVFVLVILGKSFQHEVKGKTTYLFGSIHKLRSQIG
jgi:hypothetical protein